MDQGANDAIVGVILAGGLSRRMGRGDKGLLPLGSTTLLGKVVHRISPQVRCVVLNANGDPARFIGLGLPIVPDTIDGLPGPLAGILAGMRWAAAKVADATHVLTVSSDAPFLPSDLATRLAAASHETACGSAYACSRGTVHPVIGLWSLDLAEDLEATLRAGRRKVLAWVERHGAAAVDFPMIEVGTQTVDPFFNANTPAELDEARRLLELMRL